MKEKKIRKKEKKIKKKNLFEVNKLLLHTF